MDERETPHVIEVDDYVNARLDEAKDHFGRMLDRAVEKIRDDTRDKIREALSLVMMLTAASWGALAQDVDNTRVVAAAVTLAIILAAASYLVWSWLRRRRRAKQRDAKEF